MAGVQKKYNHKFIKLRRHREEMGVELKDLGKIVDIHPEHISRIERGIVEPRVTTLYFLTKALGISIDYLMEDYKDEKFDHLVKAWQTSKNDGNDQETRRLFEEWVEEKRRP